MSSITSLPTTSNTASTYFVASHDNITYRFAWQDLANSVQGIGPQGPRGIAGNNGLNGNQGATGATALQGAQGAQGTGPQGTVGSQGTQAAQGAQGAAGQNPAFNVIPVPTTSSSIGFVGQVAADSTYIYICVATNTWRRIYAPVSSGF